VEGTSRELPFAVLLAAMFGFAKAAFLGLLGIIGIATWDDVSDPWGIGALVLAGLFAIASYALMRGSRAGRLFIGGLAVVSGVLALVYVFTGPSSAIVPSLVTAALDALLLWLLYGTRGARAFFG
jgi:hypothetical protein